LRADCACLIASARDSPPARRTARLRALPLAAALCRIERAGRLLTATWAGVSPGGATGPRLRACAVRAVVAPCMGGCADCEAAFAPPAPRGEFIGWRANAGRRRGVKCAERGIARDRLGRSASGVDRNDAR